ncbi:Pentatricopeptide repeat-containing protein [Zea mays]|jgi:pentatricopeptide repeat protein|uniref:Pentatricopeptide repeat-containing protein n=2 Tax=Zea mays TaxID=4577 RepID=A0A1D6ELX6_MAIZE|nr:pentatricopeptide repeat-containing protein At1g71490 [Zea mays]ONM20884.1 Pentatricopeptide repeat-containing protein [Zea mays]PWZ40880.1 Pentatricopeptide repeat-containing protein [Zea mays]|eukprot:XP_008670041.1 pentatricopeptide repeat-containing protein At1g71490 [Zea mays]
MSAAAALLPRPPPPNPAATVHSLFAYLSDPAALHHLPAPLLAFSQLRHLLPPAAATQLLLRPIASLLQLHRSDLRIGLQLHGLSLSLGLSCYSHLLPRLLSFYSHHPSLLPAASSLAAGSTCPEPYNVLISNCLNHGLPHHALAAYHEMIDKDAVPPDAFTYPKVLRACAETGNLALGRAVHVRAVDAGMDGHLFFQNALVSMYAKCWDLAAARTVFDGMEHRDVVSWNSMISGYAASGQWRKAVELFLRMQAEGAEMNSVTWNTIAGGYIQMHDYRAAVGLIRDMVRGGASIDFVTLVIGSNACSRAGWLRLGKEIHGLAVRMQCHEIDSVINAVITMYARCNDMERALMLFKMIRCPGLVAWNTTIAGFALLDDAEAASRLFREMVVCGDVQPNYVTVVTYLALCARVANLQHGRELHTHIVKQGFKGYRLLWNSLIDMYSKSGRLSVAQNVFDTMDDPDMISFTSMIAGYGMQGKGIISLRFFKQMIDSGIMPDAIIMVTVLSACSHSGLVGEGEELFDKMVKSYGIKPQMEHYSCMVDLYARAGLLEKAEELLNQTPFPPTSTMVAALVGACHEQGNIIIGERSARRLLEMKTENAGHFVLIANMYAAAGCWNELATVRKLMRDLGVMKAPGLAWADLGNGFTPFLVGDRSNPLAPEIYEVLDELTEQMSNMNNCSDPDILSMEEHME